MYLYLCLPFCSLVDTTTGNHTSQSVGECHGVWRGKISFFVAIQQTLHWVSPFRDECSHAGGATSRWRKWVWSTSSLQSQISQLVALEKGQHWVLFNQLFPLQVVINKPTIWTACCRYSSWLPHYVPLSTTQPVEWDKMNNTRPIHRNDVE